MLHLYYFVIYVILYQMYMQNVEILEKNIQSKLQFFYNLYINLINIFNN